MEDSILIEREKREDDMLEKIARVMLLIAEFQRKKEEEINNNDNNL
ncbi:MAG: hypothetical protein KGI50_00220 [Patescibacteria group bacterium]|nr:hypothetical protein [Patescibacteria group bacterium]MDE2438213.1 hypothetical protein [Patescibacteria group bacterium]